MTDRLRGVIDGGAKVLRWAAHGTATTLLFCWAIAVAAGDGPPLPVGGEAPPFSTELLKPGLYRINGAGSGTLLRVDAKGLIVVDAKRAGSYGALMREIGRIAESPGQRVGALVLTAAGPDQAGNVAQFVDAGVPIVVQKRALPRLGSAARADNTPATRPVISYDNDYLLRVGDFEVEIEHVGRGRTGADSVLYFRDLRVLGVGELFTTDTPEPDCASGGSYAGWAAAIAHLMWFDFDVAVPSRGAPVAKHDLVAFKARLEALAARAGTSSSGQPACHLPS